MADKHRHTGYAGLVRRSAAQTRARPPAEEDLDLLLNQFEEKKSRRTDASPSNKVDPINALRKALLSEYIPIFVELTEKYAKSRISLEMDASNLLQGGREIRIAFAVGDFRTELLGTVTTEAIAFHLTHYAPGTGGQIASGPLLMLRRLNAKTFRDFICGQLSALVRTAMRNIS